MWYFIFQPHHEMKILLSPKRNFSVMVAVINCGHIDKKSLLAGCGIQESVEQYMMCVTA